ncbi:MAG TPA: bacterioferritin [Rhizomicrobium sp.]|nr:bacterioferritin [Rhizomicrobium sp.]
MPGQDRGAGQGRGRSGGRERSGVSKALIADAKTIEHLQKILKNELTAINQYFLHARILASWGVSELAKKEYEESVDEMRHADKLTQRILFLGDLPNLQYLDKLLIGETVEEIIACDLEFEEKALKDLREAIAYAESVQDYGSRLLYEEILRNEEEHVDYLMTQQRLIASIGHADYIQVQTHANEAQALDPPGEK